MESVSVASRGKGIGVGPLVWFGGFIVFGVFLVALGLIAVRALQMSSFSPNLSSNASAESISQATVGNVAEFAAASVSGVFGTLQFSLAVLSGLIIVFAAIVTFVVGRSATQAQEASRAEIREMSDLYKTSIEILRNTTIADARKEVDEYIKVVDAKKEVTDLRQWIDELREEHQRLAPIIEDFKRIEASSSEMDTDYVATLKSLESKFDSPEKMQREKIVNDPEFRAQYRTAFQLVQKGASRRLINGNQAFNAAQRASAMEFPDIALRLATWAYWLKPTDVYLLRRLRAEYEMGDHYDVQRSEAGNSFVLCSTNPQNDPEEANRIRGKAMEAARQAAERAETCDIELLLAEVWNMHIHAGAITDFTRLIRPIIDQREASHEFVPSYYYVKLVQGYVLAGEPGWRNDALQCARSAVEKLQLESPTCSWFSHSARELPVYLMKAQISPEELRFDVGPEPKGGTDTN